VSRSYKLVFFITAVVAFAVTFQTFSHTAQAGIINYVGPDDGPDGPGGLDGWMGSTVWYAGVSESNNATEMRFGAPASITGNVLDFDPQNFEASTNGNASEIVDSQLNFMVIALGNNVIDNLQFSEAGDTALFAFSPDQAFSSVAANIFVEVVELDGSPVGVPLNFNSTMVFTPSNGDYEVGVDGSPAVNELWTGTALIDIEAELALQGFVLGVDYDLGATKLNVAIDNTLTAASTGAASAFIRKKDFDGLTVTTNIPEPTTLAGLSLMGLLVMARRRRS